MSWDAVRAWRDRLRAVDAGDLGTGLSPEGARAALGDALNALSDDALAEVAALPLAPFPRAAVVPASTVFTAPVEWCAALLGRGSEVVVKRPRARSGLVDAMVAAAGPLPLGAVDDRGVVGQADLVVAMGSDASVAGIRAALRAGARLAAHGHAWSCAWVVGDDGWDALARDLAMHDGRGCLSPAVVFVAHPADVAADALAEAMSRVQARWPRGAVDPSEGAAIRARGALARVLGRAREGEGWAVHVLPPDRFSPASLPRAAQVVPVADIHEAARLAAAWPALSTVGSDDPAASRAFSAATSRCCALGEMQRPPLRRRQDGVDWIVEETGTRIEPEVSQKA